MYSLFHESCLPIPIPFTSIICPIHWSSLLTGLLVLRGREYILYFLFVWYLSQWGSILIEISGNYLHTHSKQQQYPAIFVQKWLVWQTFLPGSSSARIIANTKTNLFEKLKYLWIFIYLQNSSSSVFSTQICSFRAWFCHI